MLNVGCRPWLSQDRRRGSSDYHRQPSHRGYIGQRRCDALGSRCEAGELGDVFWSGGQESDWKEGVCCSWASKMFCLIFVRSFTAQVSIRGVVMSPRLPLSYNHYALKIELIEFTGCCRLYNLCREAVWSALPLSIDKEHFPPPRSKNRRCCQSPSIQTRRWSATCHPSSLWCWPRARPRGPRVVVAWAAVVSIWWACQIRQRVSMMIEW